MTQEKRRRFLIETLRREQPEYADIEIPADEAGQKKLLRAFLNVRVPMPAKAEFLEVQDAYLKEETRKKGIVTLAALKPSRSGIYLWKGDITTLACDAIVNAANSQMLGCFCPNHGCIDNQIHTFSGVQLRLACAELMKEQGFSEPTGTAKITPAYNLPCKYVIHTVGPIIQGRLTRRDEELLASCYRACLGLAEQNGVRSIAFCCISTGEFHFPPEKAAEIAVKTVKDYKEQTNRQMEVIFNVFKERDYDIYQRLLAADCPAEI